jgi:acyl-CoA dehydrogenase
VAARRGEELVGCAVQLSSPGVAVDVVALAGLPGMVMGHLVLTDVPCTVIGATIPVMSRARVFVAAVGLGVARRAVREALGSARGTSQGAGGEQTVQGLIADAATDLDAAMLLTWKAATAPLSLGLASMAKLAATIAAQRAVERATQVIGAESFREGHIIERLTKDVRALELFAGRTEALREAVALEGM